MSLTKEQLAMTPEELKKDVLLRQAEAILKQIDPGLEFEWVKGSPAAAPSAASVRRVMQFSG